MRLHCKRITVQYLSGDTDLWEMLGQDIRPTGFHEEPYQLIETPDTYRIENRTWNTLCLLPKQGIKSIRCEVMATEQEQRPWKRDESAALEALSENLFPHRQRKEGG